MTAQHAAPAKAQSNRKKRILALVFAALAAMLAVAGTLAFTAQTRQADNVISFGSVKMRLLETELAPDGSEVAVADGHTVKAASGKASRIVRVQNVGSSDLYVRVKPSVSAHTASGERRPADAVCELSMNEGQGARQWTRGADGWWYYNSPLAADASGAGDGETSAELMTSIEFVGDFYGVPGPGGAFVLDLDAQAVQARNNASSALEAQGWPALESEDEEGQE